ncbi:MAG: M48 family metallopeptidase [Oscillibacter sp.]|nr:M48 family metallopeptidase [Oscillibacter sp.]
MERYELIRSNRKTLALEITRDGHVIVRAPMRTAKRDIDAFVSAHGAWIAKGLEKQRRRAAAMPPEPSAQELRAMAEKAAEIIPPKVEYWSRVTGLVPAGITITAARTRFGSCSGKNRLSFSCFLVNYPEAAVDLVVVHELCHIREKNHGPGFYALLSRYLPDHKERKKLLKSAPAQDTPEEGEELF